MVRTSKQDQEAIRAHTEGVDEDFYGPYIDSGLNCNDVLFGRPGKGFWNRSGNVQWKYAVKQLFITHAPSDDTNIEKRMSAHRIVRFVRTKKPPGRFLQRNDQDGLWHDIGDKKAIDKTLEAARNIKKLTKAATKKNEASSAEFASGKQQTSNEIICPPPSKTSNSASKKSGPNKMELESHKQQISNRKLKENIPEPLPSLNRRPWEPNSVTNLNIYRSMSVPHPPEQVKNRAILQQSSTNNVLLQNQLDYGGVSVPSFYQPYGESMGYGLAGGSSFGHPPPPVGSVLGMSHQLAFVNATFGMPASQQNQWFGINPSALDNQGGHRTSKPSDVDNTSVVVSSLSSKKRKDRLPHQTTEYKGT